MTRDMKKLLRELDLPEGCPEIDPKAVKSRVNAALNADPTERKTYMRQKIKIAAVLVAAAIALTGTALAAASNWDALSVFFTGDTSPAAEYLRTPNVSVGDGSFQVTLESCVTDGQDIFAVLTVQALTEEAKAKMAEEYFVDMDTFFFLTVDADGELGSAGMTYGPIKARETEDSQTFSMHVIGMALNLERAYFRFGFLPKDKTLDIPLDHSAGAVELTADFAAKDRNGKDYYFTGLTLSPLTFQFRYRNIQGQGLLDPVYFFQMADGSVQTMSQLLYFNEGSSETDGASRETYTFRTVQDLGAIRAVVVDGTAFPLDGGKPYGVEVDPLLYPFRLPLMARMENGNPLSLSVRALCETLGGVCTWDSATGSASLTYRGTTVVLTPGSTTALVDGERIELDNAPVAENGRIRIVPSVFSNAWGIDSSVLYEGPDRSASEWEITP